MEEIEPTGLEGAGSMYLDFENQGPREKCCLICGKSNAEQRVAHITTPGGLCLRLCETCSDRWRGYGLVVETVRESVDGAGLVPGLAESAGSPTAAAHHRSVGNADR